MLNWLSNKVEHWARPANDEAHGFYAAIAAASRAAGFYERFGVADDIDGRFDTLVLHAVLVLRRLGAGRLGAERKELAQGIIDTMFADLDLSLHELGVSDTKVGRRVKTMARAYLGRNSVYSAALDDGDVAALVAALERNLYRGERGEAKALARAVMDTAKGLDAIGDDALDAGAVAVVLGRLSGA